MFLGQRMKMELVRSYIFLSEMSTQISKSQIQNERKVHCVKSVNFPAHLGPFGTNIHRKSNVHFNLPLNLTCSQELHRELLVQDDFFLLIFQCYGIFEGIVNGWFWAKKKLCLKVLFQVEWGDRSRFSKCLTILLFLFSIAQLEIEKAMK